MPKQVRRVITPIKLIEVCGDFNCGKSYIAEKLALAFGGIFFRLPYLGVDSPTGPIIKDFLAAGVHEQAKRWWATMSLANVVEFDTQLWSLVNSHHCPLVFVVNYLRTYKALFTSRGTLNLKVAYTQLLPKPDLVLKLYGPEVERFGHFSSTNGYFKPEEFNFNLRDPELDIAKTPILEHELPITVWHTLTGAKLVDSNFQKLVEKVASFTGREIITPVSSIRSDLLVNK